VPAAQPLRPSFDYKSFLHLLPLFRRFGAAEIAQFAEQAQGIELDRGQVLFRQGEASEAGYVVVRGAVEISAQVNGYRHRIGILGPGRFCGVLALIEGEIHSMGATARERATLLALPRSAFERLFVGDDRLSFLFQDAINRELLQALARTNIHLTRLISQARIRDGGMEGRKAVELQCVLGAQDCRAVGA
jgi:CRP-like cAMP-binding protein